MIKTAYFLWQFPRKGETFIMREIDGLQAEGVPILLYSFLKPQNIFKEYSVNDLPSIPALMLSFCLIVSRHPLKVIHWLLKSCINLRRSPGRLFVFLRYFPKALVYAYDARKKGATRLHAHFANTPSELAMAAADILNMSFSFSAHANDIYAKRQCLWMKEKFSRAVRIITCTKANQSYMSETWGYPEKIKLVYHGIPINIKELPAPSHCANLCAGGRLIEKKGLLQLLCALAECRDKFYFTPKLVIFGDGPLYQQIEITAKQLGLENITLTGTLENTEVLQLIGNSRIFVHPNIICANGDRDGLANTMLEAMSTGRPVIASNIGANPEVIEDGVNGWLTPENHPEKLAKKIFCAWHNQEIDEIGNAAKATIERTFSIKKSTQTITESMFK